jgi:hypothetical protein
MLHKLQDQTRQFTDFEDFTARPILTIILTASPEFKVIFTFKACAAGLQRHAPPGGYLVRRGLRGVNDVF